MKKILLASFLLIGMVSISFAQKKAKASTPILTKHVPAAPAAEKLNAKNEGSITTASSAKVVAIDPSAGRPPKSAKAIKN